MMNVTAFGLTDVVSISLDNASYEANYKAGATLPRRARLDTKYGLCFRYCLVHFVAEVCKRKYRKKIPPLDIVLESGHANFGDAERILLEERKLWVHRGVPILRTLTKADNGESGQLMMAASQSDVGNGWEADLNLPPGRWTSAMSEMGGNADMLGCNVGPSVRRAAAWRGQQPHRRRAIAPPRAAPRLERRSCRRR
jgi:hypothetical protein